MGLEPARSISERPDQVLEAKQPKLTLQPMSDLDLKIQNGWGDTRQTELPHDWRTRKKTK
jgi:hypothetical protein